MAQYDAKDSIINGYMQDISEIQTSIEGLTQQEEMLNREGAANPEVSQDAKNKIMGDIDAIRQLIDANKKKLSELQSRVRKSNVKVAELEKMIASLNTQLAAIAINDVLNPRLTFKRYPHFNGNRLLSLNMQIPIRYMPKPPAPH